MALDTRERKEIVSATMEKLSLVIGASGNAEELVSLVTQIVKAVRRLIEGTPEGTKTKGTSLLAEFVFAAKKIAQDARAVDSSSLQSLSSTRKAVESFVKDLDSYYESRQKGNDIDLETLLSQPSQPAEPMNGVGQACPLRSPVSTENDGRLALELKRLQGLLQAKAEPQRNPKQHGEPSEVLRIAMSGLQRATESLSDASGQKAPTKATVLEPTLLLAKMVSMLIDLVDCLFVSKYPMRTQVHSFCCMLIDNALVYGEQTKSDDAASLRLISTQVPALMSALEVMVEQCYKRSENLQESRKLSIQRGVDLSDLDVNGPGQSKSPSVRRRKEPPVPPSKIVNKVHLPPPAPKEFDIVCMICTNVAVDNDSKEILTKGSEIKLNVKESTRVKDVRKILTTRTGLPFDNIQLRYRGDDVLLDDTKVTPNNPLPYFMFNLYEPGDEELQDFKRKHRRKLRMRIDDVDWTKVPSSVAVAIFDYQSLGDGEEDSLEFEEGELIEIIEKSADGWWTGKIDGKVGVIPASFVEEITVPQSKEEAKKLVKRFKQGKRGVENHSESPLPESLALEDQTSRSHTSSPSPTLPAPSHHHNPLAGVGKALRRIHSGGSHDYSKLSKRISDLGLKDKKEKKKGSLFKKRQTSHDPIMEYQEMHSPSNEQGSSLLSSPANRKAVSTIVEYTEEPQAVHPPAVKRLSRPASSPRMSRMADSKSQPGSTSALSKVATGKAPVGDSSLRVKRRPPPPPPPFQKTYPRRSGEDNVDESEPISMHVTPASPTAENTPPLDDDLPPIKSSSSMEELFRNLEEFDELASPSAQIEGEDEGDRNGRDFATIPRSELPPPKVESPRRSSSDRLTVEAAVPLKPPRRRSKKQVEPPSTPAPPPPQVASQGIENVQQPDSVVSEGRESPLPQAPPRRKSRKASEKNEEPKEKIAKSSPASTRKSTSPLPPGRDSPLLVRGKASPPVPPKPSPALPPKPKALSKPVPVWRANLEKPACSSAPVSRTVSPDDQGGLSTSARETSVSTDLLSRSPVVMRRTNAVNASLDPEFSDDELEDCTGIGKEGVLHKEGAKKVEWKSRYFRVMENCIEYFDSALDADESPSLGQILVSRMQGAVPLGEKDGFQCFAINMKYDTSVVLGCHSKMDMDDWVKSVNKMIKGTKAGEMVQTYTVAYQTALKSIAYLSTHVSEDRALIAASAPTSMVNRWLEAIDKGQEPNLSKIPSAVVAACLLRSLFKKGRLGSLIRHTISAEICELTQSANPISILSSKLDKLSPEARNLLKELLRLFAKVLEFSHKNSTELEDLNRTFGPLLFEKMNASQTEPLLAYLISTCELIIS